jgi:hypothetical protein
MLMERDRDRSTASSDDSGGTNALVPCQGPGRRMYHACAPAGQECAGHRWPQAGQMGQWCPSKTVRRNPPGCLNGLAHLGRARPNPPPRPRTPQLGRSIFKLIRHRLTRARGALTSPWHSVLVIAVPVPTPDDGSAIDGAGGQRGCR